MSWGVALRNSVGLGLGGIPSLLNSLNGAGAPDVLFDFAGTGTLDPRITFSRTSNATQFDSAGNLVYAPHNLLTYSEQFDNAAWTPAEISVTTNSVVAPNGTTTADVLIPSTVSAGHFTTQNPSFTGGFVYVFSVYAKANGYRYMRLSFPSLAFAATGRAACFDLQTGTTGQTQTGVTPAIESVGNSWYRCSIAATANATASGFTGVTVNSADDATPITFTGDGTSGISVWGAQLNVGALQPYYITTASAYYGPRFDYNPSTLAARGLLIEEQRTNLVFPSEDFAVVPWSIYNAAIVADAGTAPNGTLTADRIDSSGAGIFRAGVGVVNATAYTYSVFLKHVSGTGIISNIGFERFGAVPLPGSSSFNLLTETVISNGASVTASSITAFGNGWYRVSVTATSTDVTTTLINYAPSGNQFLMWGAQLEQGAFSTSYIPTTTAAATRAADVATVTGANFSDWYNQTEGTFYFEGSIIADTVGDQIGLNANNNAFSERIRLGKGPITPRFTIVDNGSVQADLTGGTWTINTIKKLAGAYAVNSIALSIDGAAPLTDTSATIPTPTQLQIGNEQLAAFLNGHVRVLAYYRKRLSTANLIRITR